MERFKITGNLGIAGDAYREHVTVTAIWDGRRLSVFGNRSQNVESVTEARPYPHDGRTDADRARIAAIWDRWHLNDMRVGCEHQERGDRAGFRPMTGDTCAVCGYRHGSAWNYEPVPDDVLAELRHLLDDDAHEREAPDLDDDEPEDFPHADIVSSAELIGRTFGPEIDAEIENAEGYSGEWNYGASLIADDYFEQYARDFAEDIGAVKDDTGWPANHIDWAAAADEIRQDYTAVEIDGRTYWIR